MPGDLAIVNLRSTEAGYTVCGTYEADKFVAHTEVAEARVLEIVRMKCEPIRQDLTTQLGRIGDAALVDDVIRRTDAEFERKVLKDLAGRQQRR